MLRKFKITRGSIFGGRRPGTFYHVMRAATVIPRHRSVYAQAVTYILVLGWPERAVPSQSGEFGAALLLQHTHVVRVCVRVATYVARAVWRLAREVQSTRPTLFRHTDHSAFRHARVPPAKRQEQTAQDAWLLIGPLVPFRAHLVILPSSLGS